MDELEIPDFLRADPATAGKPMPKDHPVHLAAVEQRRLKEKEARGRQRAAEKERERQAAERKRQVEAWRAQGKHYDPSSKSWVF